MTATVDAVAKFKCIHGTQIAMFGLQMFTLADVGLSFPHFFVFKQFSL